MTLDYWVQHSDNFLDYLTLVNDFDSFPEWTYWVKKIEEQLNSMDYEDALGCELEDLLNLAGISEEIRLARKKLIIDCRKKAIEQDFNA